MQGRPHIWGKIKQMMGAWCAVIFHDVPLTNMQASLMHDVMIMIGGTWQAATACIENIDDCTKYAWNIYFILCLFHLSEMPSVLWRCWLGSRKGIRPVKNEWWGAGMVICLEQGADLHMAQLLSLPLTVSCFSKIQIGFTFLPDSVLKNPFYHFHSMFQQFDPSVRSTLHRVAFAFVDWQYHIWFPILRDASFFHNTIT